MVWMSAAELKAAGEIKVRKKLFNSIKLCVHLMSQNNEK